MTNTRLPAWVETLLARMRQQANDRGTGRTAKVIIAWWADQVEAAARADLVAACPSPRLQAGELNDGQEEETQGRAVCAAADVRPIMMDLPTAHDHGDCELCAWQEARIAALEQALRDIVTDAMGHDAGE